MDSDGAAGIEAVAERLVTLYEIGFGGRRGGRFRISAKFLRRLAGRRRLHPEEIAAIGRAVYERGFVLVDLETYFVVLNQRTFASYRRVNEECLR